jgi:hypothetical protein
MLTIMICTIKSRKRFLDRLLAILNPQLTDQVRLVIDCDNGEVSIGEKRQRMLDAIPDNGGWCCFIDDDDLVSHDYCSLILEALEQDPDVVTFLQETFYDGRFDCTSRFSLENKSNHYKYSTRSKTREAVPNHLCPTRVSIMRAVGFDEINNGEDTLYEKRVRPLLDYEEHIDEVLYTYELRSHEARANEVVNSARRGGIKAPARI